MALSDRDPAAECDTAAVLDRVLEDVRPRLVETRGSVQVATPLPIVRAAEVHVHQILQNLLTNALKYRSELAPQIVVSAISAGLWWRFAIADNGIGIAPSYHEQIFGLFRRLHVQAEYPGTGVGLALCRKIVSRYGGEIWVESQEGSGATFFFTLPASVPRTGVKGFAPVPEKDVVVE
jgi:signal transduction histidine kinase